MVTKCVICNAPNPDGVEVELEEGEFFFCGEMACYRECEKRGMFKD